MLNTSSLTNYFQKVKEMLIPVHKNETKNSKIK